jgi:VanZ family protein
MRRWVVAWLPAFAWAAMIFGLSSVQGQKLPDMPAPNFDKLVHAAVYVVLGALCLRALRRTSTLPLARAVILAGALTTAYGISDEFHQSFTPQRSPDWRDAVADAAGGFAGALAAALLKSRNLNDRTKG